MKRNKRRFKGKTLKGKIVYVLGIILIVLFSPIVIIMGLLLLASPGHLAPFSDDHGQPSENSISEKTWVTINGVKQGMIIRGKNTNNPVLLFLHGGPGMPEYFFIESKDIGLEDHFTVCYWEQRGCGLSYTGGMSGDSITVDQLVSDTNEIARYLADRFGQDQIYLMAHSWGTFIGIQAAASAPKLYHSYIGIGQVVNTPESERLAYEWMLTQYQAMDNERRVKQLEAYDVLNAQPNTALLPYFQSTLRDQTMHELGIGTTHKMNSVITGIFLPVMTCHAYTLSEKIYIWRAKAFLRSDTELLDQLFTTNVPDIVPELQIPSYFMSGAYDLTVNHDLSAEYCEQLKAPAKGFYTFEQSAHSPFYEEPEQFMKVMTQDVLTGSTALADIN